NTPTVIHIVESACTPPAHNEVPGGFGELKGTNCVTIVSAGGWIYSDPGNDGPESCKGFDWSSIINTRVLVPIFEAYELQGTKARYQISGLAAFEITAICLGPKGQAPANMTQCPSDKRIEGHFTKYTSYNGQFDVDPNAAHFGVQTVKLTG
ncbi:MAG: hypothetical protein ACYC1E_18740, partial [Propionibacteriaceae bacterium]